MSVFPLLMIVFLITIPSDSSVAAESKFREIGNHFECDLPLDHFTPAGPPTSRADSSMIPAKFQANFDGFNAKQGSVIIFLTTRSIEHSSSPPFSSNNSEVLGWMNHLVAQLSSMLIVLPIRFYGNPEKPDEFFSSSNLEYLSSRQIILDLQTFVILLRAESFKGISTQTPIFLMGQKSLGSICIKAAELNPSIIGGCVAQSPYMIDSLVDSHILDTLIQHTSHECATSLQMMIEFSERKQASSAQKSEGFLSTFHSTFKGPLKKVETISHIIESIVDIIESDRIEELCDHINEEKYGESEVILELVIEFRSKLKGKDSLLSIQELKNPLNLRNAQRLWLWQQCTEFGMFLTYSDREELSIASSLLTLDFYEYKCKSVFLLNEFALPNEQVKISSSFQSIFGLLRSRSFVEAKHLEHIAERKIIVVSRKDSIYDDTVKLKQKFGNNLIECDSCQSPLFISNDSRDSIEIERIWVVIESTLIRWIVEDNLE